MTMLSTLCTKANGKIKLYDKDEFERLIAPFGDGQELELTIEAVTNKHSRAQVRFFHGPVLNAFRELGYSKQEAKDMLALMFIPQEVRRLDGVIVMAPGHTSDLKKDEYSAFIEDCIRCASEQSLVIEDADEWLRKHRRNPLSDAYAEGLQIGADIAAAMRTH